MGKWRGTSTEAREFLAAGEYSSASLLERLINRGIAHGVNVAADQVALGIPPGFQVVALRILADGIITGKLVADCGGEP